MHVEARLNGGASFAHPYCLSLDSIGNAVYSLVANNSITKQRNVDGKSGIQYMINSNELDNVAQKLHRYCSVLLQFNALCNYGVSAKL